MSVSTWILVGGSLWLVGATPVALLLGRVIRARDEQVPRDAVPARWSPQYDRNICLRRLDPRPFG